MALRVGIIGAGFGAKVHLPVFSALPEVRVTALGDSGSGRAGLAAPAGVRSGHWHDVVTAEDVDAVIVATPPVYHREVVLAALAAGKHVLCEKPFGASLADAEAMETARSAAGLIGCVGFQFRFEPHLEALRKVLAHGEAGAIRHLDFQWLTSGRADAASPWSWQHDEANGGGAVKAFGSHAVDLLAWIAGSPIDHVVSARRTIRVPHRCDAAGQLHNVTAEDEITASLCLANNVSASLSAGNCRKVSTGMRIKVEAQDGTIICRQVPPFRHEDATLEIETGGVRRRLDIEAGDTALGGDTRFPAVRRLAQAFVAAIQGGDAANVPDFAAGLAAWRMLDALGASPLDYQETQ